MSFGENLRARRLGLGYTQQDLGAMVGKTKNNISQYELGKREPDYDTLLRFARLLGATTDELLESAEAAASSSRLREGISGPAWQRSVRLDVYDRLPLTEPISARPALLAPPDAARMFFFRAPDDAMSGRRILAGDLLLIRRTDGPDSEGDVLLLERDGRPILRALRLLPGNEAQLFTANAACPPEIIKGDEIRLIGRVISVEFLV